MKKAYQISNFHSAVTHAQLVKYRVVKISESTTYQRSCKMCLIKLLLTITRQLRATSCYDLHFEH